MIGIILASTLIIAISMAFLCVKVIVRKNGRFSSMHIHDSKAMRERGIHCVLEQDKEARLITNRNKQTYEKNNLMHGGSSAAGVLVHGMQQGAAGR